MAQPLQSGDGYDNLIKNIQQWQSQQQNIQSTEYADKTLEHTEISHLSADLLSLFKEAILSLREQATIPKDAHISLERSCSALILWSDGYGIAQGHLNDIFQRSSKLRHTLLKNLSRLGRVLTERLIPLADISSEKLQQLCSSVESSIEKASSIINEDLCQQSDDSSSDAGSTFSDDNIYEVAEDLRTDTRVLSSLDPLIKYPIFDLQGGNTVKDNIHSTWSPEKFYVNKIINQFPLIDRSLASRLGNTNYERYLRCQANRDAIQNEEGATSTLQEAPEFTDTIITGSKFHDSGVGTSIVPTIIHPETILSHSRKDQPVRIPQLPKGAKDGMPFSCIACNRTVVITNNSDWKHHIYLDFQPYTCLDVSCSYSGTAFESREKWISHLALDHEMEPKWDSIECPLCKHVTGSGKLAVTRHFSKHLEEISLSALPIVANSNATSENGSEVYDSDDGGNSHKTLHPNEKDKGKSTAIADNAPINENSPCTTLYVYNLPIDVSMEELKAIFSKQQGYKKIVFRATQTIPLYFIEFDDSSSAMKALLGLHGKAQSFHKTVKGVIRLSFASNFRGQLSELGIGGGQADSWPMSPYSGERPLPPGWNIFYQEKPHVIYYYNSETNVTHWREPLFNPLYNPPPDKPPIPQGWMPLFDHGCQRWYYLDQESGRSQWEAPLTNPVYIHPPNMPPIPPGWIPLFDHRYHRWYYAYKETGKTQWEAPGVSFRETAEQAAQEAKQQDALEAEGRAAAMPKKEKEETAVSVAMKEKGDELPREEHATLQASAVKTERERSAHEEELAAREEARVAREEARVIREEVRALQEEARALREGIRAAQEVKQNIRDEDQTTQEAKEQAAREAEKQVTALDPKETN
ncbi:hypothetical protein M441DRAFT_68632 [Trichoderma asperellum CBS 433.97]|uniref:WW domain-containing protein n=1 Tax=Trichoderma asperellum (strain ATCC 204424 / CBS 433.97 / NBRC 101777) TaxID=1042311 RepID=A0A2T3Z9Y0_TRIA4|nr:hypothetical protein M441DRAFT_68632 [Trichoderma asperellum CBS 433.97]PTB41614.1 hypothetical protein M441DRAFT_68632 [Trichoderma asperellum CBS 433.97]